MIQKLCGNVVRWKAKLCDYVQVTEHWIRIHIVFNQATNDEGFCIMWFQFFLFKLIEVDSRIWFSLTLFYNFMLMKNFTKNFYHAM